MDNKVINIHTPPKIIVTNIPDNNRARRRRSGSWMTSAGSVSQHQRALTRRPIALNTSLGERQFVAITSFLPFQFAENVPASFHLSGDFFCREFAMIALDTFKLRFPRTTFHQPMQLLRDDFTEGMRRRS
jgi:hypothetical protein